jgi:hypothetical protein
MIEKNQTRKANRRSADKTAKPAPPVQKSHSDPQTTRVEARIDVGFGNALFIRGQGDGLSWDKGQPLACVDATTWTWTTRHAQEKVVFKLLLNDQVWSQGDDFVVEAGRKLAVTPGF